MHSILKQFENNLFRAHELGELAGVIKKITTSVIDVGDIYRAQIVLGVSALDQLIHEVVKLGMIECSKGVRPKTEAFLKFQLPFDSVDRALSGQANELWFGETIRKRHSWVSFQHPEKIAEAIRLISPIKLWDKVGIKMALPPQEVKDHLILIVDRRNKIAHEADMDPTNLGFQWPIDEIMSKETLKFIEQVGRSIVKVIV